MKAENEIGWLTSYNNQLFKDRETLNISRENIFDSTNTIRDVILKTIYWGYTGGMRGNHFVNIMTNIQTLEMIFSDLKSNKNLTNYDFPSLAKKFGKVPGIGLSTYSKILYFLDLKFNSNPCLILDKRLIDIFSRQIFVDYQALGTINEYNAERWYLEYLNITNKLSYDLQTKGENIEQFLFIFGNNLSKSN